MVIYMEATLNLFAQTNLEKTEKLVKQGEIKQIESGTKYLKIDDKNFGWFQ
jgi:hypothetical protein